MSSTVSSFDLKDRVSNALESLDSLSVAKKTNNVLSLKRTRIETLVQNEASITVADEPLIYSSDDILARCRPWSREDLIARASTYEVSKWFLKDSLLSPLQCSRFGWVREGPANSILCRWCKASIQASTSYTKSTKDELLYLIQQLTEAHMNSCPWKSCECSLDLARIDRDVISSLHSSWTRLVHKSIENQEGIIKLLGQDDKILKKQIHFDPAFVEDLLAILIRYGQRSSNSINMLRVMASILSLLKDKITSTGNLICSIDDLVTTSLKNRNIVVQLPTIMNVSQRVLLLDQEIDSETIRSLLCNVELIPYVLALFGLRLDANKMTLSCETCGATHPMHRTPRGPSYKRRILQRPLLTNLSSAAKTAMAAAARAVSTFSLGLENQIVSETSSNIVSVFNEDELKPDEEEEEKGNTSDSDCVDPLYSHFWYCPWIQRSESISAPTTLELSQTQSPLRSLNSTVNSVSHGLASMNAAVYGRCDLEAMSRLLLPTNEEQSNHTASTTSTTKIILNETSSVDRSSLVQGWVAWLMSLS
jgi:hypothetical protein